MTRQQGNPVLSLVHDRYHRQSLLPDFGPEGQSRLGRSHVMVIGLGALGCPAADLLARAGVGRLTLVDRDVVELTNLQRQTLFDERDAEEAAPKAEAAARRLRAVNSTVRIEALVEDFAGSDAERMVTPHPRPDVILDGTDNFETRYLINDVAVKLGVPYVYAAAVGTTGMSFTVLPGRTPCLRCVFPEPADPSVAPTCDTAGVLAPVATIAAAAQVVDALKILVGTPESLSGTLLSFDPWRNQRQRIDLAQARRVDCLCCVARRFEYLEGERAARTTTLCGRNSVQVAPPEREPIELAAVADRLRAHGPFTLTPTLLRGRLPASAGAVELTLFADGRAIFAGTTDHVQAKALYAKFIGA